MFAVCKPTAACLREWVDAADELRIGQLFNGKKRGKIELIKLDFLCQKGGCVSGSGEVDDEQPVR